MPQRIVKTNPQAQTLAEQLRTLRRLAGLTQGELAHMTGYSPRTIYRWETGRNKPRRGVLEFLRKHNRDGGFTLPSTERSFTFVDLFAGIGGMRIAFTAIGGQCVFTSEWDEYCQQTYRANFGETHPIAGDIVPIASELIPHFDVLLAGFPCQPFSIAGVSKKKSLGRPHGFDCDIQGTLFFEVARILRHHEPPAFLLENVKHLLSHDGGRTIDVMLHTLQEDLGYEVHYRVIDARCFVPQHRERVFIVGFKEPTDFSWDELQFPEAETGPRLRSILHPNDGSGEPEERYTDAKGRAKKKYVLSDKLWKYLQDYAEKHRKKGNGFGYGLCGPDDVARTLSARYYKDGSEILIRRGRGNPRRMTPRECARLMGFDRPNETPLMIPVSDTRAYQQFGNAVVPATVEVVARAMYPHIVPSSRLDPAQLELSIASRLVENG